MWVTAVILFGLGQLSAGFALWYIVRHYDKERNDWIEVIGHLTQRVKELESTSYIPQEEM